MLVRVLKSAAVAIAALGMGAGANAATVFNFSFAAPWIFSSQTGSGSGQLFANDLGNGTFEVYDVVGTATTGGGASSVALTDVSAPFFGTPTITTNSAGGYTFGGILSGSSASYNFSKRLFDSSYTISSGLRTTGSGTFSLSLVPISAPVPEAATWVMMILGFGAVGAMLRTNKSRLPGRA